MPLQLNYIDNELLMLALKEDLNTPFCDITTNALCEDLVSFSTKIVSKHAKDIVICGLFIIPAILEKLNSNVKMTTNYKDGDTLKPKEILLTLQGNAKIILMSERIILNFLRHLSAIATLTRQFVNKAKHTQLKILDTRKTTPGMRHMEKYAVQCGGGVNHRMGLYDAIMIKDTHIDLLGNIKTAIEKLPIPKTSPVVVEVRNMAELDIVMQYDRKKIDRILFDNMSIELLKECVKKCHNVFETEASGNINLDNIESIAKTGVNYASIGSLTYAAGQVDLSMVVNK